MEKVWKRLCLIICALVGGLWVAVAPHPARAQTQVTLAADELSYDAEAQVLIALGNVQIFSGDKILRTDELIYDQANGTLSVPGLLEIIGENNLTTVAQSGELSQELTEGLISGAEMLIGQRLQVAGQELHHTQGRFRTFEKAVATTCYVCNKRQIPLWQIRARRVIHDEEERRVYYEHARLEIIGVPLLWFPRLRTPDPSVDRATGFLVPTYSVSNTLGTGVSIPYYIVTGDHSDVTLTPEYYSDGSLLLTTEYRQRFRRGRITALSTLVFNDQQINESLRGNLTVSGAFAVFRDYSLSFAVDLASDDTVRSDYDVANPGRGRLTNRITLARAKKDRYFELSATAIQSIRSTEVDQQIPVSMPEYYNRRILSYDVLGGKLAFTAQSVALHRTNNSLFLRGGLRFDWRRQWRSRWGLLTDATAQVDTSLYKVSNYTGFADQSFSNAIPSVALDFRLPLAKHGKRAKHLLEPRVQFVWATDDARANPNEDSQTLEFEDTNLFTLNRYPGFDASERGLRANVGLTYSLLANSGWRFGLSAGRIFRADDLGEFRAGSGLDGRKSAYATSISLGFRDRFSLVNRMVLDDDFEIRRHEAEVFVKAEKTALAVKYAWLDAGALTATGRIQSEGSVTGSYRFNENWSLAGLYQQNLTTDVITKSSLSLKYENECIEVRLGLAVRNANHPTIEPTRTFGVQVQLAGLGSKSRRGRFKRLCNGR